MSRLPVLQRLANLASDLGDWPVVVAVSFGAGVVFALTVTGQL